MTRVADQQHEEYLTPDQARVQLEQLSRADLQRLKQISGYLARSTHDAEDLRQKAYVRVLDGSRRCRHDQEFVRFLAGSMQSIQHAERKSVARLKLREETLEQEPGLIHAKPSHDPLEVLLEEEDEAQLAMGKQKLFGDDPVAMAVIEGIMEGFQGADLCELAGITAQELATKRRLIKRRLDAAGGFRR